MIFLLKENIFPCSRIQKTYTFPWIQNWCQRDRIKLRKISNIYDKNFYKKATKGRGHFDNWNAEGRNFTSPNAANSSSSIIPRTVKCTNSTNSSWPLFKDK